ncbi:IPT/TIG domain-containing protein [Fodinibius sp.]|uniref:IPT/TIG domain-containing protein n=1 Tax=Fodinibius sp. TaxID=1872440 RepID=UPI002ACDB3BE|nr:IPT/TIG domain-containing protein [Fodinibius sp.]MDZ7657899.1 IPT/TIG domain-containing protein [Fodinibius sp.]
MNKLLQLSILFITILLLASCGSDSGGPNPEITSVQPESGPPGTSVTIAGKGFRPKGDMNVTFGGTAATLTSATEDQIQTEVPEGLSEGSAPVEVSVEGVTASGPSFIVEAKAPGISSVEPDSGTVGTEVTIKGMNFSATASENSITFNGTQATIKSASEDELITEVPQGAADGPMEVTVKQKSTTGPDFDVIMDGTLEVHTNTTGSDKDDNRYDLSIDGDAPSSVANSGIATFPDIEQGSHQLELSAIAENCSVQGQNPRTINITAGDTTSTSFDIKCQAVINDRIAFQTTRGSVADIYLMDPDGSNQQALTNDPATDYLPQISYSGTRVLFASYRNGNFNLFIVNADGSNIRQVTNSSGDTFNGSWAPDDSKIVFGDNRSGNEEIYTIAPDGSNEQLLTNTSANEKDPSWSPDGSKIVFVSKKTNTSFNIYTMNPDGSNEKQLTSTNSSDTNPVWSPDGSKIAFTSSRDGNKEIYVINADGSSPQRITKNSASDEYPSWSRNGSEIIFDSDRDGNDEIYKINADGTGSPVNLSNNSADERFPDWSPVK